MPSTRWRQTCAMFLALLLIAACCAAPPRRLPPLRDTLIVVLTFDRPAYLRRLLQSLADAIYFPEDEIDIHIRIDRSSRDNTYDNETYELARDLLWTRGMKTVEVTQMNENIVGQWTRGTEQAPFTHRMFFVFEDDTEVSQFFYVWAKEAHAHYRMRRDVAAVGLQRIYLRAKKSGNSTNYDLTVPSEHPAFLYRQPGSWGLSPVPRVWAEFLHWYRAMKIAWPPFQPYVNDSISTDWYKDHETEGRIEQMWTMWFVRFCHDRNLFVLYANFSDKRALVINHRAAGVHFPSAYGAESRLLDELPDLEDLFPPAQNTVRINWDGTML